MAHDWQPIETAPKHGEICTAREFSQGRWQFNHAWFNPATEEWQDEFGDHVLKPTHWMSLPKAASSNGDELGPIVQIETAGMENLFREGYKEEILTLVDAYASSNKGLLEAIKARTASLGSNLYLSEGPPPLLAFFKGTTKVGMFDIIDGRLHFEGDLAESGKSFITWVITTFNSSFDPITLSEREACAKICSDLADVLSKHGDKSGAGIALSLRDSILARTHKGETNETH